MVIVVIFGIVFSLAGSLALVFERRIEEMMPVCVGIMVLPIFVAGLLDKLMFGVFAVYFLCICGLAFLVVSVLKLDKERNIKGVKEFIFTPGLAIFLGFLVLGYFLCKNRLLENIDEFNHWGLIIRNMFLFDSFGTNAESIVVYNDYPPFTACFQYLFLKIQNVYDEGIIIMAQSVLYLLFIMPVTKNLKWNFKGAIKTVFLIAFLPMIFFKNFYLEILVDGILGVVFAYTVYSGYVETDEKIKYAKVLSGLIMLSLTKTTGIALAVLAILMIGIKSVIDKKKEMKFIAIVLLITILVISAWYIKVKNAQKMWDFTELAESESDRDEKEVTENFVQAIIKGQGITEKRLTVLSATMVLMAFAIILDSKLKDKNLRFYLVAMFVCVPMYLIGMLMIYLKIFQPIEAIVLACFDRYASTILLAVAAFIVYVSQEKIVSSMKENIIIIFLIFAVIPMANIDEKYINRKSSIKKAEITRNIYTKIKEYNNIFDKDDKILYIINAEADQTYLKKINEYEIMPTRISKVMIGNFANTEELYMVAKDYDYVYVYRMKKEVKENIKDAFENENIQNDTLYKVKYGEKTEEKLLEEVK